MKYIDVQKALKNSSFSHHYEKDLLTPFSKGGRGLSPAGGGLGGGPIPSKIPLNLPS